MPHQDPQARRAYERERHRRRSAERRARGLCPKCGVDPPAPGRSLCRTCGEKGRAAERARYAEGKAEGMSYGGRNSEGRRRMARERRRKRRRERREAGRCTRCGDHPPVEGGAVCGPCREVRRAAERELYAARRARGLCGRCGGEVLRKGDFADAARCGPCAALEEGRDREKRNAARRGALRPTSRVAMPLHRLRCAIRRSGEVRGLRSAFVSLLGRAQGHTHLPAALHRGRTRHRRGPRALGLLGGGRHVPRLREALPRGSGSHRRRIPMTTITAWG